MRSKLSKELVEPNDEERRRALRSSLVAPSEARRLPPELLLDLGFRGLALPFLDPELASEMGMVRSGMRSDGNVGDDTCAAAWWVMS